MIRKKRERERARERERERGREREKEREGKEGWESVIAIWLLDSVIIFSHHISEILSKIHASGNKFIVFNTIIPRFFAKLGFITEF